ncbi:class I SAM-dependent methyltransferase [Massilia sp. TWP1-3-3]|uniref:class I SAM-dependent methyltransferase n=1 Tax=Massilia sp. TWP1-3-3 TaxID=2804573 RepID=UPI003CE95F99
MTGALSDAEALVRLFGAGLVLCVGGDDSLARCLRQKGAQVHSAATLADLDAWDEAGGARYACLVVEGGAMLESSTLASSFAALRRLGARWAVLRFSQQRDMIRASREVGLRQVWEAAAVTAHFRRAPQAVSIGSYQLECQDPFVPQLLAFEAIPVAGQAPFGGTLADSTRQSGAQADAYMARYALAAAMVRGGDTVLDCGCALGAGTAILAAQSYGARYIGVAASAQAAVYAAANFGQQYGVEYVVANLANLADLSCMGNDSVDLVVALDVLAQAPDSAAFLAEAQRVLRPDGRIIVSVPNRAAPNMAGRSDVSDFATLRAALGACFLVEERFVQGAGGEKLKDARRTLDKLALAAPDDASEWLILVGSSDPLRKQASGPYRHPEFAAAALPGAWVTQFGDYYDNPWLYRSMVQIGERVRDPGVLNDLAARVLGTLPMDSADFGAALTVLAHSLSEDPHAVLVDDVLALVDAYLAQESANPHVLRWQISSAYIAGRLAMARGERELAAGYLEGVAQADFMAFSALLATKTIAASFHLGAMALAGADPGNRAAQHFANGVASCRRALKADDTNAIGNPAAPLAFGFTELAEVADMGAQCAMALRMLPLHARFPGLFWRRVDTKRFGLLTWALSLEEENLALRRRLG